MNCTNINKVYKFGKLLFNLVKFDITWEKEKIKTIEIKLQITNIEILKL